MIPLANRRPITKADLCLAAIFLLFFAILPRAHLYWLGSSSELTVHETTGPISFAGGNKNGYAILIDGQRYPKPLDYDTELAYAKQNLRWSYLTPGLILMFLVWVRLKSQSVVR